MQGLDHSVSPKKKKTYTTGLDERCESRGFGMWLPVGLIVSAERRCGLELFPPRFFYSIVGFNCLCVLMPTIFLFCVQPGAHFSSYKSHDVWNCVVCPSVFLHVCVCAIVWPDTDLSREEIAKLCC